MPSSTQPLAAIIAFVAFGATLLGTSLLLLLNPRSRSVRWHAAFSCWVMAWLAMQGWLLLQLGGAMHVRAFGFVVHMMPAFFVAATLVETRGVRDVAASGVVLLGLLTAVPLNPLASSAPAIAWQSGLWLAGGFMHYFARQDNAAGAKSGGGRALRLALLIVVPVAVAGVIVVRGAFLLYALPALMIGIQLMIFIGVIHHRFYDIEVRAARSGELAARAAEQERLALLGELSATLAHEIRNPLTGIRSLTQRLGEPLDGERRARYVDVVLDEITRLDRIVGSLLDLGRRSNLRDDDATTATPLAALFEDVALLVDARAKRAGVTLETDAAALAVDAPRDALAQALLNLLLNAIAHSPDGGVVRLDAMPAGERSVAIRVRDSGPGVPEDLRDIIFEPFQTRGLGTGLGLAVVRRITIELGWQIGVHEAPEGGALFELRLPAAAAAAPASQPITATRRTRP
jgi:signal transduction histidine kinase